MFCPKCGSQNVDEAKFCRGCGADLSNVLAVVEGKPTLTRPVDEEYIHLFSTGIRNVVLAFGFAAIAFIVAMIPGDTHFWVLFLIPAFPLLASGISRIIKADALKAMRKTDARSLPPSHPAQILTPGRADYIKPQPSIYETDDLLEVPHISVTEGTTRHLSIDTDDGVEK